MVAFTQIAVLLAAAYASANPVALPNEESPLEARSGQRYTCSSGANNHGQHYGDISQDKAIGYFRDAKTHAGASGYPKPFDNKGKVMKFAKGCGKDVYELPVLASGKPYDYKRKKGNDNLPGPMRVYYTKDLKFCAIGAKLNADGTGNPHNCAIIR